MRAKELTNFISGEGALPCRLGTCWSTRWPQVFTAAAPQSSAHSFPAGLMGVIAGERQRLRGSCDGIHSGLANLSRLLWLQVTKTFPKLAEAAKEDIGV